CAIHLHYQLAKPPKHSMLKWISLSICHALSTYHDIQTRTHTRTHIFKVTYSNSSEIYLLSFILTHSLACLHTRQYWKKASSSFFTILYFFLFICTSFYHPPYRRQRRPFSLQKAIKYQSKVFHSPNSMCSHSLTHTLTHTAGVHSLTLTTLTRSD
ncbi:unnamed protein product, partial [Ceratitis capitata]